MNAAGESQSARGEEAEEGGSWRGYGSARLSWRPRGGSWRAGPEESRSSPPLLPQTIVASFTKCWTRELGLCPSLPPAPSMPTRRENLTPLPYTESEDTKKRRLNRITAIGQYIDQTRSYQFLTATYLK